MQCFKSDALLNNGWTDWSLTCITRDHYSTLIWSKFEYCLKFHRPSILSDLSRAHTHVHKSHCEKWNTFGRENTHFWFEWYTTFSLNMHTFLKKASNVAHTTENIHLNATLESHTHIHTHHRPNKWDIMRFDVKFNTNFRRYLFWIVESIVHCDTN